VQRAGGRKALFRHHLHRGFTTKGTVQEAAEVSHMRNTSQKEVLMLTEMIL
jgi:hypothetical protein